MSPATALDRLAAGGLDLAETSRLLRALLAETDHEGATAATRLLLRHRLHLDLTGLVRDRDRRLTPEEGRDLAALARRRLAGEPVQRLVGSAGFWGRDFALSPATLVPRPDTETLVAAVLDRLPADAAFHFADLGTGSGAILVTILGERPRARGIATDLSAEALATARRNAEANGLADRATFLRASYAEPFGPASLDAIVSNPPYIASDEIATLDREVRLHDPRLALDGGGDGLDAYRAIAPQAARALRPTGLLAVEIGHDQGREVTAILAAAGFLDLVTLPDLAGRDRVVLGHRPPDIGGSLTEP